MAGDAGDVEQAETPEPSRLLLPVPGLGVSRTWDVGVVRFHPAGSASEMIRLATLAGSGSGPAWYQEHVTAKGSELDKYVAAEVTVVEIDEAIALVQRALAVLRAVQHMESPNSDIRRQTFGLPGQVGSARIDYIALSQGATAGWKRWGALAGWSFNDQSHERWTTDPAYRFLHQALSQPDVDRTDLQRRALIAVDLLSQAWSSWQPDVSLLNHAMAVEALLGEPRDQVKKVRIARRVSYFFCGWPNCYQDGLRPPCPYLSLPVGSRGQAGQELNKIIQGGRQKAYDEGIYCSTFFDLLDLYDDRNAIVHNGKLDLTAAEEGPATWFIASYLLRPVLAWFAAHPDADLRSLDAEISLLPPWRPAVIVNSGLAPGQQ